MAPFIQYIDLNNLQKKRRQSSYRNSILFREENLFLLPMYT